MGVWCTPGPVVALTAQEDHPDDSTTPPPALLAVVYHQTSPDVHHRTQRLSVDVYNMSRLSKVESCPLPLTPPPPSSSRGGVKKGGLLGNGALLSWIGFSEEGVLSSYDSCGVLRVRWDRFTL